MLVENWKTLNCKCVIFLFLILMDRNMWNNQKIHIDWNFCFTCQQQGKENFTWQHKKLSNCCIIQFVRISHAQVPFLLYLMMQDWKIMQLKKTQSTTRFVQIVMTDRNYNVPLITRIVFSEAHNLIELRPSLSRWFRNNKKLGVVLRYLQRRRFIR